MRSISTCHKLPGLNLVQPLLVVDGVVDVEKFGGWGEKCDLRLNMPKNIKIFRKFPQMMASTVVAIMRLSTGKVSDSVNKKATELEL